MAAGSLSRLDGLEINQADKTPFRVMRDGFFANQPLANRVAAFSQKISVQMLIFLLSGFDLFILSKLVATL